MVPSEFAVNPPGSAGSERIDSIPSDRFDPMRLRSRSMQDPRAIERSLEDGSLTAAAALEPLADGLTTGRAVAARVLGSIAGRSYDASWETAERAAFILLDTVRDADAQSGRVSLLHSIGRGFRNAWLMPYVHSRLFDEDDVVVEAAIGAAGGLGFPALEETIASTFLDPHVAPQLRFAALGALGHMGAESASARIAAYVGEAPECAAALAALTEIRSPAGRDAARKLLGDDPDREVMLAALRYLAEIGDDAVLPLVRTFARAESSELRLAAMEASRAYEAEKRNDPDERILAALTERDRAVRSVLARRLRTLSPSDVLARAEVLFGDDPRGVIQVIAEIRSPETTRMLLKIAADESADVLVRARAAGSIEANEAWERDALAEVAAGAGAVDVRVAAAQTLGAFAPPAFVLDKLAKLADDPAPTVRGALLWALQLSAHPHDLGGKERTRAEAVVQKALTDANENVRRRAAYVAANLDAVSLVPDLVALAQREDERVELRIAAFAALGDIGSPARFADLVHLWNRESDPRALWAASRALERSLLVSEGPDRERDSHPPPSLSPRSAPPSINRLNDRLPKLLASPDARIRGAAARVAGLAPGVVPADVLIPLAHDPSPRVREKTIAAIGRVLGAGGEGLLVDALDDAEQAVRERAAEALLTIGGPDAFGCVVAFIATTPDRGAALRLTKLLSVRSDDVAIRALGAAVARVDHDDPIYELLVALKLAGLEARAPVEKASQPVDQAIAALFPAWTKLQTVRGFVPLAKSLRTAEMLYAASGAGVDADQSAAIVLWMKCLEGYMHAWLAPRLRSLQDRSAVVWDLADRLLGGGWTGYQRWLGERWHDPVKVGALEVEVPLRSAINALRDLQEKRGRNLDSPMSVTEWSRIMLFLALEHGSGPKNLLAIACKDADRMAKLAHKLQVLAQVRNTVTHRSTADASTLEAFRRSYYSAFDELTGMA